MSTEEPKTLTDSEYRYFMELAGALEALVDAFKFGGIDDPGLRTRAHDLRWDVIEWTKAHSEKKA